MRLTLRIIGTTLLALALILIILDGTRSLGENRLVLMPLSAFWQMAHPASLEALRGFLASRFFGPLLEAVVDAVLALPGWVVLGVPGALLAWAGRSRRTRLFVKEDRL